MQSSLILEHQQSPPATPVDSASAATIDSLQLPHRLSVSLFIAGIHTVESLQEIPAPSLLNIKGVGKKGFCVLVTVLRSKGIELAGAAGVLEYREFSQELAAMSLAGEVRNGYRLPGRKKSPEGRKPSVSTQARERLYEAYPHPEKAGLKPGHDCKREPQHYYRNEAGTAISIQINL